MPSPEDVRGWAARASVLLSLDVGIEPTRMIAGRFAIPWETLAADLPDASGSQEGAAAVVRWHRALTWVAGSHAEIIADMVRVVGAPASHPFHPGSGWVVERVHGGSLDLGLGIAGIDSDDPDRAVPVPHGIWAAAGVDPSRWWARARLLHERMGEAGGLRYATGDTAGRLRPMGGHDVVTLLGARTFRQVLADRGDMGMAGVAVPFRDDGWILTTLLDPAFAAVAAGAAAPDVVGFARPVLVTADEVVEPPVGGAPVLALGDRAPADADLPPDGSTVPYYA